MWKVRVSHCFDVTSILTKGILLVGDSKTDDGLRKVTEDVWKDIIFYNIFYWEGVCFVHKTKLSITLRHLSVKIGHDHMKKTKYIHTVIVPTLCSPLKNFETLYMTSNLFLLII